MVAVAHLVMQPTGCDNTTWSKGCVNKIAFCSSLFTPSCNCASLRIENDYKLVRLPNSLVDEMTALKKVFIRNCNLTKLLRMEQLTEMVDFEISYNNLSEFKVDITKWDKLKSLYLFNNKITKYDQKALWTHPNVAGIQLESNIGFEVPGTKIMMPSLHYLALSNNEMTLNTDFNKENFPNLLYLYLNGNYLLKFPDVSLQDNIVNLGISRCNFKITPLYLSNFKRLAT